MAKPRGGILPWLGTTGISSVWSKCLASTVSAYSVSYQPRLLTANPVSGSEPWLVLTRVSPNGLAQARAHQKASGVEGET